MSHIIQEWLQKKLGIIIDLSPDSFADLTRNGHLLARILRHYDIINEDQFKMIKTTNSRADCLENFKQHLYYWLQTVNIVLKNDELTDIVEGKDLASLSLFYRLFLELHEKDCLTFIARNRLNEKFHPKLARFQVQKVKENFYEPVTDSTYGQNLENSYDVIHWLQDRLEMVVNKCKSAREEYLSLTKGADKRMSGSFEQPYLENATEDTCDQIPNRSEVSLNQTFEELLKEKKDVRKMKPFIPNPKEADKIVTKIKDKMKTRAENKVYIKELQKDILEHFWSKLIHEEAVDFDKDITEKLLKQSVFEKQMQQKLREVKEEKNKMLETKKILSQKIAKEKDAEFVERLLENGEMINKEEFQYYVEKERALQLHRAIYKERQRLRAERTLKICRDTTEGICDMAMRFVEYKDFFGEEPTERILDNWRKMVGEEQPWEEAHIPIEALLSSGSGDGEVESIVHREVDRQNRMDKKDLESYLSFDWPWLFNQIAPELIEEMHCGMNILGHIVHLLLTVKYPPPTLPLPFTLEDMPIRVCVNGIPDQSCLPLLQKLLKHRQILVVELQDAVNYGINAYKIETASESVGDEEEKDAEIPQRVSQKISRKGSKSKALPDPLLVAPFEEKQDRCVQTPRHMPDERVDLSPAAELGRIADNELSFGNFLTDFLMISMFVEYIRAHENIKGWALINYPTNFEQALLLEEAVSGLVVPGIPDSRKLSKSLIDIASIGEHSTKVLDKEAQKSSKLLFDPDGKKDPPPYETILTAFINVNRANEINEEYDLPTDLNDMQDSNFLQQFYTDMGCNYAVRYQLFDYFTVKHIAKLIIGDFSVPPKTSVELFGETIRYLDADKGEDLRSVNSFKLGEKKERDRIEKVVVKPKSLRESQNGEGSGVKQAATPPPKKDKKGGGNEDKFTQIPETIIVDVEEEIPHKPGEEGWDYDNIPLPNEIGVMLAEMWENIEEIYINDLSQVLFEKRLHMNPLMTYVHYTKSIIAHHLKKIDQKPLFLLQFQDSFNKIDDDFRRDEEFKAEIYCLVKQMKNKMMDVVDSNMLRTERRRQTLIDENWGPRQLIELTNNYISAFQIELDRHMDSIVLINDYFTGIITQVPGDEVVLKENLPLPKLNLDSPDIEKEINAIFLNAESVLWNPLMSRIDNVYRKALAIVERCEATAYAGYNKVRGFFSFENENGSNPKIKYVKAKSTPKGGLVGIFEPPDKIKNNAPVIFEAWTATIKGEIARIKIRLNLLKTDATDNIDVILNTLKNSFHGMYEQNKDNYEQTVHSINQACYVISSAIEKEVPIQEEMLFAGKEFIMRPDDLLLPDPEKEVYEPPDGLIFSLNQLWGIMEIFFDIAPNGYMSDRTFTYILQDITLNNDKELSPLEWTKLTGPNITQLSQELLGAQTSVYWKDFIIYNLMVPFPKITEIISTRNDFLDIDTELTELVTMQEFECMKFWFDESNQLDVSAVKKLLYRMYQTDRKSINYTSMLFDFCKGENVAEGLAKALAVVSGKAVCWDECIGKVFVECVLVERKLYDETVKRRNLERQENTKLATTIIDDLIDITIHTCDSLIITDITDGVINKVEEKTPLSSTSKAIIPEESEKKNNTLADLSTERSSTNNGTNVEVTDQVPQSDQTKEVDANSVAIGYEVKKYPPLEYFLNFDDICTVLKRALCFKSSYKLDDPELNKVNSFHARLFEIYEESRNPDFNNEVLSHEYLNNVKMLELIENTNKFLIKRPYVIVEDFLTELQLLEC